jgi:hypothetical protein
MTLPFPSTIEVSDMSMRAILGLLGVVTTLGLTSPPRAMGHYIWLVAEPGRPGESLIRAFFNEPPEPDASYLKYVRELPIRVDGQIVPSTLQDESRDARWAGKPAALFDTERDLGVMTRGGATFRLRYTARAQTEAVAADFKESGDQLRVRVIEEAGKTPLEVLHEGKPVPKARIRAYPEDGEPFETFADEQGRAEIEGLTLGKTAVWANWVDRTPGEIDGKPYFETRYYATLTFRPLRRSTASGTQSQSAGASVFATMTEPAVNSFGAAVLGQWLYVYSGHVGQTHRYSVETTAKSFRRLNLEDRTTWEELPIRQDLQGVALVSDGQALYRIGGMVARNQPGEEHDLHSVADFARFDPATKVWTDLAPLPEPRSTHDAVVIDRTIFVVGGWTMRGHSEESPFVDTALSFNLDRPEDGWKVLPQPFQRRALSAAECGGRLYVLGGLMGGGMSVSRRVDIHDPKTGVWSRGPDLPAAGRTEGFGTASFGIAGRLYHSGSSGRIHRLSEDGETWEAIGAWSLPRITHRILPGPNHTLLAVGGNHQGRQTAVIEAIPLSEAGGPRPVSSSD